MISFLKGLYTSEQFKPSILSLLFNPYYFERKGLFIHIRDLSSQISGRVLDIGCGQKPYQKLFNCREYVGIEIDTPENRLNKKADVFYKNGRIPFEDGTFDSVVISQVFEHVFDPKQMLSEIFRLLKPGGRLLMTVPFVWDEHEQPFDFARYSSFGLAHLLNAQGFKIISSKKSMNDIRVIFQLVNVYLYKKLISVSKNEYLNLIVIFLVMSPFNIAGELFSLISPKNNDLYLDNIVLAQK